MVVSVDVESWLQRLHDDNRGSQHDDLFVSWSDQFIISFRAAALTLVSSHGCLSANEVTLKDMG